MSPTAGHRDPPFLTWPGRHPGRRLSRCPGARPLRGRATSCGTGLAWPSRRASVVIHARGRRRPTQGLQTQRVSRPGSSSACSSSRSCIVTAGTADVTAGTADMERPPSEKICPRPGRDPEFCPRSQGAPHPGPGTRPAPLWRRATGVCSLTYILFGHHRTALPWGQAKVGGWRLSSTPEEDGTPDRQHRRDDRRLHGAGHSAHGVAACAAA
jgi:hypothetical protein